MVGINSTASSRIDAPSSSGPMRRARKACCWAPLLVPKAGVQQASTRPDTRLGKVAAVCSATMPPMLWPTSTA